MKIGDKVTYTNQESGITYPGTIVKPNGPMAPKCHAVQIAEFSAICPGKVIVCREADLEVRP